MYNTVECPHCGYENDMTDVFESLDNDNTTDWECGDCEEEFEIYVEYDPIFTASKIERLNCEMCNKQVSKLHYKGKTSPFPEEYGDMMVCSTCYWENY